MKLPVHTMFLFRIDERGETENNVCDRILERWELGNVVPQKLKGSLGITWVHLGLLGFTRGYLDIFMLPWVHFGYLGLT